MAHYVMSDIHGEAERFYAMLDKIGFSKSDTLYILGDVIDRGPDGIELLQYIMASRNIELLMGNHEYMCMMSLGREPDPVERQRWNANGNRPTVAAFYQLDRNTQRRLVRFLESLPFHMDIKVNGKRFYLVHGFPRRDAYDELWGRPGLDEPNPIGDCQLIIGHTPVLNLIRGSDARYTYANDLMNRGDHLRICHAPGFIDIDCACGHSLPIRALACLRLEDMEEFYT